jgi:hypothetical protein
MSDMFTGMGKHWGRGFGANMWGVGYALRNAKKAARLHKRTHVGDNFRQTDYKAEVSQTAGKIYSLLSGRDWINLDELREGTRHKGTTFMAALGWLMREDKIEVAAKEHSLMFRVKA